MRSSQGDRDPPNGAALPAGAARPQPPGGRALPAAGRRPLWKAFLPYHRAGMHRGLSRIGYVMATNGAARSSPHVTVPAELREGCWVPQVPPSRRRSRRVTPKRAFCTEP